MRTNRHKPGNMAVLVNAPRPGLRNFEDVTRGGVAAGIEPAIRLIAQLALRPPIRYNAIG